MNMRETEKGAFYVSNNPSFPGQVFYVEDQKDAPRFSKPNRMLTLKRYAFSVKRGAWYLVATESTWLYTGKECVLGVEVPKELHSELKAGN